jgi:hypothetical protein
MGALPEGLLVEIQRRLEAIYGLDAEAPVTDFLISESASAALPGLGSRTLLSQQGEEVALAVVLEDNVHEGLAHGDPRVCLDDGNLPALCVLTEEVSHFLYLLFCARSGRTITELELELQGEVDKYLTATCLLSLQNEGAVSKQLRRLLFRRYRLREGLTLERVERYHTASRLADRYCGWLERRLLQPSRLPELCRETRRFYRLGQREKLERIADVA